MTAEQDLADLAEVVLRVGRELEPRRVAASITPLTGTEATVLRFLDAAEGTTLTDLAAATGLQRSNLSVALRGLERQGMIERRPAPHDHRSSTFHLTPRAHDDVAALRRAWAERMRGALGDDTAGVRAAADLLGRIDAAMAARNARGG